MLHRARLAGTTNVFWSIGKPTIQYRKGLRYNNRLVWYWPCSALRESAVIESASNLPNNPIKSLEKVVSRYRAAGDNTPLMGLDCWEIQSLGRREPTSAKRAFHQVGHLTSLLYLLVSHRAVYVLLIGENKQGCASQSLKETVTLHRMSPNSMNVRTSSRSKL
jgi:hypothetical protein